MREKGISQTKDKMAWVRRVNTFAESFSKVRPNPANVTGEKMFQSAIGSAPGAF